jgi:uncharacterized protein (DUF1697 family)
VNTYVALLRGINVGRAKRISMADLRALIGGFGHADVSTYLQSGNALFSTARSDTEALAGEVEQAIGQELGMSVRCVLRDRAELARVVADNPLAGVATDPRRLLVSFANIKPDPARLSALDVQAYLPEQFAVAEREIYAWLPEGVLESKLTNAFFEKQFGGEKAGFVCTARNWNTVTKLLELPG